MGIPITQLELRPMLLALGAAVIGVLILAALNRHLRLFTRGTVAFMVTVLMVVTIESVVEHLNDRRNRDASVRAAAAIQTADNFLHSWLEHRPRESTLACVEPGAIVHVDQRMSALTNAVVASLPGKDMAPDLATWKLMALDVGSTYWRSGDYRFSALLDTTAEIVRVRGVLTLIESSPPQVVDVTFESATVLGDGDWPTYFRHSTWRNPAYEPIASPSADRSGVRVRRK